MGCTPKNIHELVYSVNSNPVPSRETAPSSAPRPAIPTERKVPGYLDRREFLGCLEFPNSVKGMKEYERYLETVEEADPRKHDELTQRYCWGWAVASEECRKDIKELYRGLPERAGSQGMGIPL